MKNTSAYWINKLNLQAHPEGGYYSLNYQSPFYLKKTIEDKEVERFAMSNIYFLLETGNFSAFHRLQSDELWHFYTGNPVEIFYIQKNGKLEHKKLGDSFGFQILVPKNTWFSSRVIGQGFSLVACTVAPAFDFEDFELAKRDELIKKYPQHEKIITSLTRI